MQRPYTRTARPIILSGAFLAIAFAAAVASAPADTLGPASAAADTTKIVQAAPSPTVAPTTAPVPPWSFTGFADVTYTTPLANNGTFVFANGVPNRVFDGVTGIGTPSAQMTRFVPNNFNFFLKKNAAQGLGGNLEVSLGSDANVIASYQGAAGTYTDVTQANLFYAAGPFTLTVGKFETLAGYEVIEAPGNQNISRSILFGSMPFTHTGARLVYAAPSHITLTAGVNYGWDQLVSTKGLNTFEGAVGWAPSSAFTFQANYYTGSEPSLLTPYPPNAFTLYGTRSLIDLVAHWNPSSSLNFGVNFDNLRQTNEQQFDSTGALLLDPTGSFPIIGTSTQTGIAGYASWIFNPHWTLTGRLESLKDGNGMRTGIAQTWNEGTATLQYNPTATNWKLRGEYRNDWSNQSVFARYTSPFGSTSKTNSSLGLEAIYTWP